MNEKDWLAADKIARELVQRECDPNEVQKAFVYLRTHKDGKKFFDLLNAFVRHGRYLMRSGRTMDYYRSMLDVCKRHLTVYSSDAETMAQVLGWSVRLMKFHISQSAGTQSQGNPHFRNSNRR